MKMRGDILINGRPEKLSFGTSAYVTQENVLMATLTVTEAVRYSAQLQLPESMPIAEKRARADRVIQQMGLTRWPTFGSAAACARASAAARGSVSASAVAD
ncbi:hypothetical protein GUJ93_ZPchr0007g5058 [Zizania palustris]|uniref:ABC transporter domain-containing protein n=1 Tax=Zizania palustris TaxID=103762 RepID=A0A8J5SV43_ZIZPA|nr:hypothetical protein GUJ93_ZPchr0007g5058 [Zizania palustris]